MGDEEIWAKVRELCSYSQSFGKPCLFRDLADGEKLWMLIWIRESSEEDQISNLIMYHHEVL